MGKKIIQIREGDKGLFLSLDKGVRFLRAVYIKRQFAQPRHDSRYTRRLKEGVPFTIITKTASPKRNNF